MNLFTRIGRRLAIVLVLLMTLWAALFYFAMVDDIRDEVDDTLEDYTSLIVTRKLAGQKLPTEGDGTNNYYTIKRGDTLSALARKFNTTIANLMALNPHIKNANLIYEGDTIRIR